MNINDPRTWGDDLIEKGYEFASEVNILVGTVEYQTRVGQFVNSIKQEAIRRAMVRINRGDFSRNHSADWYK
jgi:hypothetical protein